MARAPARAPAAPAPGALPPVDGLMTPGGGPGDAPDTGDATATDEGGDGDVIVSICRESDGSYTVYPGPPPEAAEGEADLSADDVGAMGAAGGGPAGGGGPGAGPALGGPMAGGGGAGGGGAGGGGAGGGIPADSIGQALAVALKILQADEGDEGGGPDQFEAGFNGPTEPTPVGMSQKYPRA